MLTPSHHSLGPSSSTRSPKLPTGCGKRRYAEDSSFMHLESPSPTSSGSMSSISSCFPLSPSSSHSGLFATTLAPSLFLLSILSPAPSSMCNAATETVEAASSSCSALRYCASITWLGKRYVKPQLMRQGAPKATHHLTSSNKGIRKGWNNNNLGNVEQVIWMEGEFGERERENGRGN